MKQIVFHIVFLALIAHTCKATIIITTPNRERINSVYDATMDLLTRCYWVSGGNAVGIVGDSDGFVRALWSKHQIPAVLIESTLNTDARVININRHRLQVVVIIAATPQRFQTLLVKFARSIWWNNNAKLLILSPRPDKYVPASYVIYMLYIAYAGCGVLGAQFIQSTRSMVVAIYDFNPFKCNAPEPWESVGTYGSQLMLIYMFARIYRKCEDTCEASTFKKTSDIGGYPFEFVVTSSWVQCQLTNTCDPSLAESTNSVREIDELLISQYRWFIGIITKAMNASVVIKDYSYDNNWDISVIPGLYSDLNANQLSADEVIHTYIQAPLFAMTQHTGHMTQLEKIMSVIDKTSQIGMYTVYFVTFLFFTFFLRQSLVTSLLNLVRLTCNTGLPKLPTNVAPTVYLACLFMFVITLQAIYTGNLASLLTTTIAYPHVNTKEDIPKLGYTVYAHRSVYNKIAADPVLEGRVVQIEVGDRCESYVLSDPLGSCVSDYYTLVTFATMLNFHLSRDPLQHDYYYYVLSTNNPLGLRVQDIIITFHECGLRRFEEAYYKLQSELVDDNEVKQNKVRRIMNISDLRFAFVILGIGIICSIICFIVEISIYYISKRLAKRRDRVRPILALAVTKKKSSWYTALKLRFNGLRLFPLRR